MTEHEIVQWRLGCGWYDRIEPLANGTVRPRDLRLEVDTVDDPRQLFDRLVRSNDFDAAEMSSAEHITRTAQGDNPFVGLPIFTSRMFRHSFICINANAGIRSPRDLAGRRIGVPLYSMSAAIWCRGLLRDQYGVDLDDVTWVEGSMDHAGGHGIAAPTRAGANRRIISNTSGRSLSDLLEAGDIDATIGALMPSCFGRAAHVQRLFPNYREVERAYYRETGIHPIMHMIVVRRASHERAPWAAQALVDALDRAKRIALERMFYTGAPKTMLPFLHAEVDETRALFGDDPWPDGIEANRRTLEKAIDYMLADGLIARKIRVEELFPATTTT